MVLKSSPAAVLVLAFVPVELFLEIRLGVRESSESAQWGRELLATCSAGNDTRHRSKCLTILTARFVMSFMLGAYKMQVNAFGG
jgi:hypothetical protein